MNRTLVVGSFLFFLTLFTLIGALAARVKKSTSEDYLLASRDVSPWLVALSAVSTNNSGYMFIGLIGFAWRAGLEAMWVSLGWILGDLATWLWVHRRVRQQSGEVSATSFPGLLATRHDGSQSRVLAVATGIITFFFLAGYAAAQLKAGSTTLHALFDWPLWLGAVIGVVIVTIYCMSGGIRASIWTDAAQALVMVGSMSILLASCMMAAGGPAEMMASLRDIDPSLVSLVPEGLAFGFGLYLLGWCFGGAAVIGQPHVMVRFMALDSVKSIRKARAVYFVWFTFFSVVSVAVGLYSRVLMPELGAGLSGAELTAATEGALPQLSIEMLPAVLIGVMLAGLFSATMSTADSQLLSCSAAVTQDVVPRWKSSYRASKVATLAVAALALGIALTATSGVFALVLMAWTTLGAAFGPVLLVRLARRPLPDALALLMMASGVATVFGWSRSPWAGSVFEALPGMLLPLLVYALGMLFWRSAAAPSPSSPVSPAQD